MFLVDDNRGYYYRVGIKCENLQEAMAYLESISNDIRYLETVIFNKKIHIGKRKLPFGKVVYCKYAYDKCNTFSLSCSKVPPDRRHIWIK